MMKLSRMSKFVLLISPLALPWQPEPTRKINTQSWTRSRPRSCRNTTSTPCEELMAEESQPTAAFTARTEGNTVSEDRSADADCVYQQGGSPHCQQNVRMRNDSVIPSDRTLHTCRK